MNKKLYAEQKHTLYEIQKHLGLTHDTLYKYARKPEKIKTMSFYLLEGIAEFEGLEPLELKNKMVAYQQENKTIDEGEKINEL